VVLNRPVSRMLGAALAVGVVAAGAACDKVPLTAPTASLIVLFANTTSVPINGVAEVTATVTESAGTPVQNGTVVTFFTSLGTIDPPEARTQGGKATVRLRAGASSGVATVRASSGGNTTIDPQLTIAVGAAAAARIELFAEPATLPSGGGTVQLRAVAYDSGGNRLPSVQVSFSTTAGTLTVQAATTDAGGEARSALTTNVETTVTATVSAASDKNVTASVKVGLRNAPTVTIAVGTAAPTARQPVSFTFTVAAGASGSAVRTAVATFGDGDSQVLGTSGATPASHTYNAAGTYTVTATATDAAGETTVATASVTVTAALPSRVELFATPTSLPAAGGTAQLLAVAFDSNGRRMASAAVSFSTTAGTLSVNSTSTDGNGEARSTLTTTVEATVTVIVAAPGSQGITNTVRIPVRTAPTVTLTGPTGATAGQAASFNVTITTAAGAAAVRTAFIDFGDGSREAIGNTGPTSVSHTFANPGTYTVTAWATDAAGETGRGVAVINVAPAVPINVTVTASTSGGVTTFTTTVLPSDAKIARYEWNFGDGSPIRVTTGGSTTYVYTASGTYTVVVRVVTNDGREGLGQIQVKI